MDREGQRVLDALEAYLASVDPTRGLRKAFLAGVAVGRKLGARKLSTGGLSTYPQATTNGHVGVPPLRDPPFTPTPLQILSIPDPDPERSMECANETGALELFPRSVPLERRRKLRCRIPADFTLTPRLVAFAEAGGLNASEELAAMRDHFRGTGQTRADWSATFREWCRHSFDHTRRARR
jgi:hypothetical protein